MRAAFAASVLASIFNPEDERKPEMNQKPDMKQMTRLAINSDWTSDINDPRIAPYLRPLSIAADEEMAN
jgi:hypothetical protein